MVPEMHMVQLRTCWQTTYIHNIDQSNFLRKYPIGVCVCVLEYVTSDAWSHSSFIFILIDSWMLFDFFSS